MYFGTRVAMKVYKQYNNSSYSNVQIQLPTPTLVGYESLDKSQYPDQTPKIKEIWHKVNSPDTDPFDKVGLMSESYIDGLLARFDLALHAGVCSKKVGIIIKE